MDISRLIAKYHLPIVFVAMLVLPFINSQFGIWKFERADENRSFKDSITVDLTHLDILAPEVELYVNDNFSFREPLLKLFHHLHFYVFKVSPHPDQTLVGREGWYFMSGKEKDIYEGRLNFTDETKKAFLSEWNRRKLIADSLDIGLYWVIAPMKHYVYPEHLPFNIHKNETRRVNELCAFMEDNIPGLVIDPMSGMLDFKESTKLFYQLDNHWNERSGYIATGILMDRIKKDYPDLAFDSLPFIEWKDSLVHAGIHHNVIGIESLSEIRQVPVIPNPRSVVAPEYEFPLPLGFAYPWEFERRFTSDTTQSKLRVLFIRDSFGNQMVPFVKEMFSETVFIFDAWQYEMDEAILEQVKPDILIYLTSEPLLESVLE
jgi:hypothetical protein